MKLIDFESHFYSDSLFDALCLRDEYPYCKDRNTFRFSDDFGVPVLNTLFLHTDEYINNRIAEMDACGVSTQVLGISQGLEELQVSQSIECARATHDLIYEVSKNYPDRFICFGTFPVGDIDASIAEMERCKNELGFKGWMTFSNYRYSYIDEPQYRPLLAAAERLKLPIYIHPTAPVIDRLGGLGSAMAGGAMGFTVDTAITAARLIFQGTFDEFPDLQLILGHLGEGLPYSLDRMDKRSSAQKASKSRNEHLPSYYFGKNIWVTTSGMFSNPTFECAKAVLGIDRILFGSDYPYERLPDAVDYVEELPISGGDRAKLYYENAQRLFSL